jgi:hypothetical protein
VDADYGVAIETEEEAKGSSDLADLWVGRHSDVAPECALVVAEDGVAMAFVCNILGTFGILDKQKLQIHEHHPEISERKVDKHTRFVDLFDQRSVDGQDTGGQIVECFGVLVAVDVRQGPEVQDAGGIGGGKQDGREMGNGLCQVCDVQMTETAAEADMQVFAELQRPVKELGCFLFLFIAHHGVCDEESFRFPVAYFRLFLEIVE